MFGIGWAGRMELRFVNGLDLRRARGIMENPRLQSNLLNFGKLEMSRVSSLSFQMWSETLPKSYRRRHTPRHRVCFQCFESSLHELRCINEKFTTNIPQGLIFCSKTMVFVHFTNKAMHRYVVSQGHRKPSLAKPSYMLVLADVLYFPLLQNAIQGAKCKEDPQ